MIPDNAAQLLDAYRAQCDQIRDQLLDFVTQAFEAMPDQRGEALAAFVEQVVPVAEGAQAAVGSLTDAYLAMLEETIIASGITPAGVSAEQLSTQALRGVSAEELWARPTVAVRTALSNGTAFDEALRMGLDRARLLARTNVQLARTHAARAYLGGNSEVVGHRRAPRGPHSCALCLVASTQRYHKSQLMPIHPGCDCDVFPIFGSHDPGHVIDSAQLEAVHDEIRQRTGMSDRGAREPDYRKYLIVHEHGELGPVLAIRGQHFTKL